MSKAYSNKALPPGTVLREWRLENVLGVGGFGIVYKGRGIYFDELVAIKEYFPSSISERDEDATVVPIDSDAEEVHALGLKKFVEEAKLLWNLSTPSRHPNIVSVRSLFEIHGTAYMVMDFEDGMSLSKLLKEGHRWNESSLTNLFKPIAEGLERAHRVGVLHRDIKPPNILVNDDGRPVLFDFGSARFESGEATSTSVTFHTPPYAAIEQYVKTYDQGPWTDIYALGVVLYQCITGEKPAEVLERMHASLGKPLAEGDWPGYSKQFLAGVDAAMTVKPTERPQSISEWLKMFDDGAAPAVTAPPPPEEPEIDDDATRIEAYQPEEPPSEAIVPVAPTPDGFSKSDDIETPVPDHPKDAQFKRAGEDTKTGAKLKKSPEPKDEAEPKPDEPDAKEEPKKEAEKPKAKVPDKKKATPEKKDDKAKDEKEDDGAKAKQGAKPAPTSEPAPAKESGTPSKKEDDKKAAAKSDTAKPKQDDATSKKKLNPIVIGGAAAALAVVAIGGWAVMGGSDEETEEADSSLVEEEIEPIDIEAAGGIAQAVLAFSEEAIEARIPTAAKEQIQAAAQNLADIESELQEMASDPSQATAIEERQAEMAEIAKTAGAEFAELILRDADAAGRRLANELPWADPRNSGASAGESPAHQTAARNVRVALSGIRAASSEAAEAEDPATALTAAQQAMARYGTFNSSIARARRVTATPEPEATETAVATPTPTATVAVDAGPRGQASSLFAAKYRRFNSIVSNARNVADDIIDLGGGSAPAADAPQSERDNYRIREANVQTARSYIGQLDTNVNSMRGERTEGEVDQLIANVDQLRQYLEQVRASSRAASR